MQLLILVLQKRSPLSPLYFFVVHFIVLKSLEKKISEAWNSMITPILIQYVIFVLLCCLLFGFFGGETVATNQSSRSKLMFHIFDK